MKPIDLQTLLKGDDPSKIGGDALMTKAYWRVDHDEHLAAFLLFEAAAKQLARTKDKAGERAAIDRAAIALHRSGTNAKQATARLNEVIRFYREHKDDEAAVEIWMVDAAYVCLLEQLAAKPVSAKKFVRARLTALLA